jgi:lipopolysaccharide/colanic/teichoic acid biosynthesis glycosyltransferase
MCLKIPNREDLKKMSFAELKDAEFYGNLASRKPFYRFIKRIVDIVISLVALIAFAPLWLLIILLIRMNSKGPAIFSHNRVGKNGKIFRLYKFRTMQQGVGAEEFAPTTLDDPRITGVGRFLRRISLDEVPQFWNVMKGEMSFIGPRPEMQFLVAKYDSMQKKRLLVKPGMTGLWQILGRKDIPLHENAEYDYYYILHQSLFLDLQILLKTFSVVVSGKGAY